MGVEVPSLAEYARWRHAAGRKVVHALGLYGRYCAGQYAGMGDALNIMAVQFLCQAEAIPLESWGEMAEDMKLIHSIIVERSKAEKNG